MLKDRTSPLRRAWKSLHVKFKHIELAVGRDFHSKILGGCT